MNNKSLISVLFLAAAIYDGVLGLVFLLTGNAVFERFGAPPPSHPGYLQFPAALLIVFALMFVAIARDPARNWNLIPYGILLKLAYCCIVFFHWFATGISTMWKPFAVIDLVFIGAFAWSYAVLRTPTARAGNG